MYSPSDPSNAQEELRVNTTDTISAQGDVKVLWENQFLDIDAIEADVESDVKPDKYALDKIIAKSFVVEEYSKGNKCQNLRSSLSGAAKSYGEINENLREMEEHTESMLNERQLTSKQFEESLISGRMNIQKSEDKLLSMKLECDNKLRDIYVQKERYECESSIYQRKHDLSRDFTRKQGLFVSNMKKQITQFQKDIQREIDLQSELETQTEVLEKDIKSLEDTNESLHCKLLELERNVEIEVQLSLEYKENIARKDNEITVLNKEYQRLVEKNEELKKEVQNIKLEKKDEILKSSEFSKQDTSTIKDSTICDEEIKIKEKELENILLEINAAETKVAALNVQANNYISNKRKLLEIKFLLANNNNTATITESKEKNEITNPIEDEKLISEVVSYVMEDKMDIVNNESNIIDS